MLSRAATESDRPALTDLQHRWDLAWFAASEHDENEVGDTLDRVDLAANSRVLLGGDRLIGAAYWWGTETFLLADPGTDPGPVHADLLDWYGTQPVERLNILGRDTALQAAVIARGWVHRRSSFELIRAVSPEWELSEPEWPDDVELRPLRESDAAAIHHLIYVEAGWAEVPGHDDRELAEWRSIFITPDAPPEQQVLAWRGDTLVGAALGKIFADGTGWVGQLAVGRDGRGAGLGRALLLEAFRRRREAGATSLGLAVQAENRAALVLYLGVGLVVDREWMQFYRAD